MAFVEIWFGGGKKPARREMFSESIWSKPSLDFNYNFPIGSAPYGIPLGAKSNGKISVWLTKFRKDFSECNNVAKLL